MLKILWKRGEIAPEEQFLLLSTVFCYLILDFYVKTRIRFPLRDKRLFGIAEVEITRVDCISILDFDSAIRLRSPCLTTLLSQQCLEQLGPGLHFSLVLETR